MSLQWLSAEALDGLSKSRSTGATIEKLMWIRFVVALGFLTRYWSKTRGFRYHHLIPGTWSVNSLIYHKLKHPTECQKPLEGKVSRKVVRLIQPVLTG